MTNDSPKLTREEALFIATTLPHARTDLVRNREHQTQIRNQLMAKFSYAFDDGSTASGRVPSVGYKVIDENPAHTRITVWVGRTPGARGNSGTLTVRTDELSELVHGWERLL